jgi:RNA polymerase sigma-70 factor, ECF subfamily
MDAPDPGALDASDMARLNAGHDAALNAIMDRHGEPLFHYLLRQLGNEADAADLAQETFARVYLHRARFRPADKFSTWLYAIATNLVRDRFRWRSRHPQVSLDAADEDTSGIKDALPDATASPSEQADAHERSAAVREAVESLPEDLRTPLILSEYEDLPHAQIAAVLNCSAKAVESRLYRARARLRERLGGLLQTP